MYHGSKNIVSIILLLLSSWSFAQKDLQRTSERDIEAKTYAFYQTKEWSKLLAFGDSALQQNTDYYYLRFRMGVANYELGKYLTAKKHFRKAIEFNSTAEISTRYLYMCYQYTGEYEQARKLAKTLTTHSQNILGYDPNRMLNYVGFLPGLKASGSVDVPIASLLGVSVGHNIFNDVSVNHVLSNYSQGNDIWGYNQKEYFLQVNIPLKKSALFSASYHFVDGNTTFYYNGFEQTANAKSHAISLFVNRQIGNHNFALGSIGLEVDTIFQMQHDFGYSFFPKSNTDVVFGIKGYIHSRDFYDNIFFSALPYVSFKPTKKLSVFASYLWNNGNNIAEWNGFILNNSPDLTAGKFTLNASYQIHSQWNLGLTFEQEKKQSELVTNYTYNSIYLSLKYIPK